MEQNFKASHRYALSLLESGLEKKNIERIYKDMLLIVNALQSSRELQTVLQSPVIRSEMKQKVMSEVFKSKIDSETMDFIKFVIEKRREQIFHSIASRFLVLYDEHIGIVNVEIITAFEFTDDQKKPLQLKIEQMLNKKVKLKFRIDNELIGGFIARVGDTLYDASLKHQLEILKNQFLKGSRLLN